MKAFSIILVVAIAARSLHGQIVNDGASRTLINETNTFTGDVTVGTNGSFTLLVLSDNALLTNSLNGVIGRNANAKSNEVRLLSPSARWFVGNLLLVGTNGAFNRLVVSNGATVRDNHAELGLNVSASNNVAVVTGLGSVWSNANLFYLGVNGAGNQLIVTNGGVLRANSSSASISSSSSNNLAVVTGSGSLWTNAFALQFGFNGAGNQLVISNGGVLCSSPGYLGTGAAASSNVALVTGSGSLWTNTTDLFVGHSGAGNRLLVSAGGTVRNGHGYIGGSAFGSNNLALITGAGSTWNNALDLDIGAFSANNQMIVSNGAKVFDANNGFIGQAANGNANSVTVTDPGTIWNNTLHTFVGVDGTDNHLVISNGGFVTNGLDGLIGVNSDAEANKVMLTGLGSRWVVNRFFELGRSGDGNQLFIENGASLVDGKATIGVLSASQGNLASVSGPGTTWTNFSTLEIGAAGSGNVLIVSNGACVVSSNGTIGALASARGNGAGMFSPNSRWLMEGDLHVGSNGPSSLLFLNGGGPVVNANGIIGFRSTSSSNRAAVVGAGAVWSNRESLYIGHSGNGNQLGVSGGGMVWTPYTSMGFLASSSNNSALVIDAGSLWTNVAELFIGDSGPGNQVVVSNGGFVLNRYVAVGFNDTSSNNIVLVTDGGSVCSSATALDVGRNGSRNQLVVGNGATVTAGTSVIVGVFSNSLNNRVVVDGGSLMVSNGFGSGVLDIRRGTNVLSAGLIDVQQLRLTNTLGFFEFNGGTLVTRSAVVSNSAPFVVGRTGAVPAVWDVRPGVSPHALSSFFVVGENVPFCQLLVTNGALLTAPDGVIGNTSGSHSNQLIVSGPGSRLETLGDLYVGNFSSANSLVISNGGWVSAVIPVIGFDRSSANNQALVAGNGSLWTIRDSLEVGQGGAANRALIAEGGAVIVSNTVTVGFTVATSSNNLLHIASGTLFVTNAAATGTLDIRSGTNRLDAGLIHMDRLRLTNSLGRFEFNGGKLSVGNSTVSNGQLFRVGNGASPATFALTGNGTHSFANGLTLSANATLTGNGNVGGILSVQTSGTVAPGTSVGKIVLSNSPSLQGAVVMEISKNGSLLTNDQVQATAPLTYGGSLVVSNLGPSALAAGDNFKLFSAGTFAGSFAPISLPPLNAGLGWTNKLLVDGSIEVIGVAQPKFASLTVSGTNVSFGGTGGPPNAPYAVLTATNVALPSSNWVSLRTNQFDASGNFSFTNPIAPGELQRYFRIRTP